MANPQDQWVHDVLGVPLGQFPDAIVTPQDQIKEKPPDGAGNQPATAEAAKVSSIVAAIKSGNNPDPNLENAVFSERNPNAKANLAKALEDLGDLSYIPEKFSYKDLKSKYDARKATALFKERAKRADEAKALNERTQKAGDPVTTAVKKLFPEQPPPPERTSGSHDAETTALDAQFKGTTKLSSPGIPFEGRSKPVSKFQYENGPKKSYAPGAAIEFIVVPPDDFNRLPGEKRVVIVAGSDPAVIDKYLLTTPNRQNVRLTAPATPGKYVIRVDVGGDPQRDTEREFEVTAPPGR